MSAILRGALPSLHRPLALSSVSLYSVSFFTYLPATQRAATTLSAGFPSEPSQPVSISRPDIPFSDIAFSTLKNTVVSTLYAFVLIYGTAS